MSPNSYGIGIDIGGTSTRVVVFDHADRAVHHDVAPTVPGPEPLVDDLTCRVTAAIDASPSRPSTIGIGIPGTVRDGVVAMALNVGIDGKLDLAGRLADRTALPVRVENDVNAAALGACTALFNPDSSLTYLSIGTGVAAGTVVAGDIVRGAVGAAGELGHVSLPGRVERCVCGQSGCIEAIASGRSVIARMRAEGLDGAVVELFETADGSGVAAETAAQICGDMVGALGWAVQLAVLMNDVEHIVLGGGVAVALGDRLADAVRSDLAERERRAPFLREIDLSGRVRAAVPGIEFGALGAHRSALMTVGSER